METKAKNNRILSLTALLLFAVFVLCVLAALLGGAEIYRSVTARDRESFDRRTAVQYVATRLRQADSAGTVSVEEFAGGDALVLTEEIGGRSYCTRVYCCGGYLRELFAPADSVLPPEAGESLLPLEGLELSFGEGFLQATLRFSDGSEEQAGFALRSGEVQP